MSTENSSNTMARADGWHAQRSKKQLEVTAKIGAHQKNWFKNVQDRVKSGEHVAVCDAGEAEEIFTTMDIPVIVKHWWSGAIAAKQMSAHYFDVLGHQGYTDCRYCALGLGCTMAKDPEKAPWGGLPRPTLIVGGQITGCECDSCQRITQLWAREYGAAHYSFEETYPTKLIPRWWERMKDHWDEILEPRRLDLKVEEFKGLIKYLEVVTGKTFSRAKFREVMELVNEQNSYFKKIHDIIAETVPAPIGVAEQVSIYRTQWHRGTPIGLELTKQVYQEVKARADNGIGACDHERFRLLWVGVGMWHNPAFYQYFEEQYGAVFTACLYLAIAADGYQRALKDDPLRALASRSIFLGLGGADWHVKEAQVNKIDGVVMLVNKNCREMIDTPILRLAFERAGIPVLPLWADNVDAREWDDEGFKAQVGSFIETRLMPLKQ